MAFQLASILETTAFQFLDEVLAEFHSKDGFAKNNRWEILITPPTGNRGGSTGNIFAPIMGANVGEGVTQKTALMCEAFSFPGRNLTTTPDTNLYGPEREMVNGYTFGDISSSDHKEKQFFDTWQRLAYNPQDFSIGYYYDYVGEIRLYQLDEQDRRRYGIKLLECFPKTVDQMTVTQGAGDLQRVNVTWAYRYWLSLADEPNAPKPLEDRLAEIAINTISKNIFNNIPSVVRKLF
jgi:hypothetical protein